MYVSYPSVKIISMISIIFEFITRIVIWIVKNIFEMISFFLRQLFRLLRLFFVAMPATAIVYSVFFFALTVSLFSGESALSAIPVSLQSDEIRSMILQVLSQYLIFMNSYSGTLLYFVLILFLLILFLPVSCVLIAVGTFAISLKFLAIGALIDAFLYLVVGALLGKAPTRMLLSRYKKLFPKSGRHMDEQSYQRWLRRHSEEFDDDTFSRAQNHADYYMDNHFKGSDYSTEDFYGDRELVYEGNGYYGERRNFHSNKYYIDDDYIEEYDDDEDYIDKFYDDEDYIEEFDDEDYIEEFDDDEDYTEEFDDEDYTEDFDDSEGYIEEFDDDEDSNRYEQRSTRRNSRSWAGKNSSGYSDRTARRNSSRYSGTTAGRNSSRYSDNSAGRNSGNNSTGKNSGSKKGGNSASSATSTSSFNFFAGCNTPESADRKYKQLVKLYHPDNMDGDTAALQEINVQYDNLKKKFK